MSTLISCRYAIALTCFPKFGPLRLKKLLEFFDNNYLEIYEAKRSDLLMAGIEPLIADEFLVWRQSFCLDSVLARLAQENISVLPITDSRYPAVLKELFNPPALLYYRGRLIFSDNSLAVVGSRLCSSYGRRSLEYLMNDLEFSGLTIVSGLALGIDAWAHSLALKNSLPTIAVLGSGLNWSSFYPLDNKYLAEKIIQSGGLILSEFPLDTLPLKFNFLQRNRIIAALSKGVFVVEAHKKSGALNTASQALEIGREVLALGGDIFSPASVGTNELIKNGAKSVTSANDLLELFSLEKKLYESSSRDLDLSSDILEERLILEALRSGPLGISEIKNISQLDTALINSTLSIMELKRLVLRLPLGEYALNFSKKK